MKKTTRSRNNRCGNLLSHLDDSLRAAYFAAIIEFLSMSYNPQAVRSIVAVIILLSSGSVSAAIEYSGLKHTSVYKLRAYLWDKIDPACLSSLFLVQPRGRISPIISFKQQILNDINRLNFFTLKDIREHIIATYGVSCSLKYLSRFLKQNGVRKLRCGSIPFKADFEAQVKFYNETLSVYIKEALEKKRVLLFMDASHFVMGCDFLGAVYSIARRFMRTSSGRNRYNVLGALDYVTHQIITVTNKKYIGADEVCKLLRKIKLTYKGAQTISIILDNARYQKCKVVTELAEELGIELVFLPTYSPNLNFIERIWKFVKTELRKGNYSTFVEFQKKIDELIDSTTTTNQERINSLIGEKVQLFDNTRKINETTVEETVKTSETEKAA